MATYKQRDNGTWRAEIVRVGIPYQTKDGFATKRAAQAWAGPIEFAAKNTTRKTLHDAFKRYVETVSIHKKGARWERVRIAAFKRQLPDRQLTAFGSDAVSKWRDERLKTVSTGTVRREMNLFGNILETATVEWKWLEVNPFRAVKRPPDGKGRERIVTDAELAAHIKECRTELERRAGQAFCFAMECGMRAGEICGIRKPRIFPKHVKLPDTKNGEGRNVPLSMKARRLLPADGFNLTSAQLDVHFRAVRDRLKQDYTFHASRHTAATRIGHSGKLSVFELAAMFGWKDLKIAMGYIHSETSSIADRL